MTFHTEASLVPGDSDESGEPVGGTAFCLTLRDEDVFVRDRLTGSTTRVSVTPAGKKANGPSMWPAISGDGRRIVFASYAYDIAPGDRPSDAPYSCVHSGDVFVHTFPVLR